MSREQSDANEGVSCVDRLESPDERLSWLVLSRILWDSPVNLEDLSHRIAVGITARILGMGEKSQFWLLAEDCVLTELQRSVLWLITQPKPEA